MTQRLRMPARRVPRAAFAAALAGALAGCAAVGPDHRAPQPATADAAWQAPRPADADRGDGRPGDAGPGDAATWWQRFDDPTLAALQAAALEGSTSVAQALARVEQARATARQSRASALPSLSGNAGVTRARSANGAGGGGGGAGSGAGSGAAGGTADGAGLGSAAGTGSSGSPIFTTTRSAAVDLNWEIDLFGAVRRSREAALARLDARVADAEAARLALEAEVASAYVRYRACGQLVDTAERNTVSTTETVKLTRLNTDAGFTAPATLARVEASLAESRSRTTQQRGQCELDVKQLVELTGLAEPALRARLAESGASASAAAAASSVNTASATPRPAPLPQPASLRIDEVPARVLERRRDLAAAERSLAAASAEIGVALADRLPRISLIGSIGRSRTEFGGISSEGTNWSFGPSLSLPIFDAGRRAAEVDAARARYAEAEASYRATVRTAVREVEQALVDLDTAQRRTDDARAAVEGYDRYLASIDARYRFGGASVLELEEARRTALAARETLIGIERDRVNAWITLHRATGGGWRADDDRQGAAPGAAARPS